MSYSDLIVNRLVALASGEAVSPAATAALEIAAGHWARAFASATVKPDHPAISPFVLSQIGRGLCRRGESVWDIRVVDGKPRLLEVYDFDVEGGVDPASWRYRLTLGGPSGSETVNRAADGVVHLRYSCDPSEPWKGISPLGWASLTGELHAAVEQALSDESRFTIGQVLPMPEGRAADEDEAVKIRALKGRLLLVETTAGGDGDRAQAPKDDWQQRRLGMNPPAGEIDLRNGTAVSVLMACGIPPSLVTTPADGGAQREALRRFLHVTIEPVARIVSQGLSGALDANLRLGFTALQASDVAGRSRSLKQLVEAGIDLAEARELVGLA